MIIKLTNFKILSATALLTLGVTILVIKRRRNRYNSSKNKLVLIHYKDAYSKCPSRSIELIQLETWLRISGIRYDLNLINSRFYSYHNKPKIVLHGITLSGIDEAVNYLERVYGKDLSDCLNRIEKSIARSFLVFNKDSLAKSILIFRYLFGSQEDIQLTWTEFVPSKEEVSETIELDLMAMQDFLKYKKFLFGETPTANDAALFGVLSQIFCLNNSKIESLNKQKFPFLFRYFENLKSIYWKDWEDRCR
ncbi:failed axon connections -like protein [Brachionus plicatilis]|uniref:Failed axon connections-like protein n=1 Tax=Brachionus plicatilis TaxID=10195 RepID=A0A3M7RNR2_BRAPC|nr:failed axon connections -like protein [Brachionus plicatilis]